MIRISPFLRCPSPARHPGVIACLLAGLSCAALAEAEPRRPASAPAVSVDRLQAETRESDAVRRRLADEIAAGAAASEILARDLVASAARVQQAEADLSGLEARMRDMDLRETGLSGSLGERREVLARLLAALQRAGLSLSRDGRDTPEDASAIVSAAALLGALGSDVARHAEALTRDLAALRQLHEEGKAEHARLADAFAALHRERAGLRDLVEARRASVAALEDELRGETVRAEALARQAALAADLASRSAPALDEPVQAADERPSKEAMLFQDKLARAIEGQPRELAPDRPFTRTKGSLIRPASGTLIRTFGQKDGQGGVSRGIVIATRSQAVVTSPVDARVAYAGSFRSYGRLLILDAGEGYYILLSGLDQISVDTARFVLAGEPVGYMGQTASLSAAMAAVEGNGPALYVEFRKNSAPIDPSPWWVQSQGEKVRG